MLIVLVGVIFVISLLLLLESATSGGSINENPTSSLLIPTVLSAVAGYLLKGVPSLIVIAPQGTARIERFWEKPIVSAVIIIILAVLSVSGIFLAIALMTTFSTTSSATDLLFAFLTGNNPIELPITIFFTFILAGGAGLFATCLALIYYTGYPWIKGFHASVWRVLFSFFLWFLDEAVEDAFVGRCPQCCHEVFQIVEFDGNRYCSCGFCGLVKSALHDDGLHPFMFFSIELEEES